MCGAIIMYNCFLTHYQVDRSGKLGFDEFKTLWTDLRIWKVCILKFSTVLTFLARC